MYWYCAGAALAVLRDCMGTAWGLHGYCMGTVWGLHGDCMGTAWGLHGDCMGTAVALHWHGNFTSGTALVAHWYCITLVLYSRRGDPEVLLRRHYAGRRWCCNGTHLALGLHWCCSGTALVLVLWRSWCRTALVLDLCRARIVLVLSWREYGYVVGTAPMQQQQNAKTMLRFVRIRGPSAHVGATLRTTPGSRLRAAPWRTRRRRRARRPVRPAARPPTSARVRAHAAAPAGAG